MALYAGVDRVQYPGDRVMGLLRKNTNLRWCGLYLQYADWQPKYGVLKDMGWGVAPVYGGNVVTLPRGSYDIDIEIAVPEADPIIVRCCVWADGNVLRAVRED